MSLPECRSAIARTLRANVKGVDIHEHGGPLTPEEIKRLGKNTPAALVACLGITKFEVQGTVVCADAVFAVFCLARDAVKATRDVGVLLVAEAVAAEVPMQRWGGAATKAPTDVTGRNMFSTPLDKEGFSLWVVQWRQKVDLRRNAVAELVPFETFFATYDLAVVGSEDNDPDDTATTTDATELDQ